MIDFKLFILLVLFCSCKGNPQPQTIKDNDYPICSASQLTNRLTSLLSQSDSSIKDSLNAFFSDWNKSVPANSFEFINQNDTTQTIFSIFKEFYRPINLTSLGKWEGGNALNQNSQYVIVQNNIPYSVMNTDTISKFSFVNMKSSITNFRPPVNFDKSKILYLTSEYKESITSFWYLLNKKSAKENIATTNNPMVKLLRLYIPIHLAHSSNNILIETHPLVTGIVINKTLSKAVLRFQVGYEGGEASLAKVKDNWIIISSKETWIQ